MSDNLHTIFSGSECPPHSLLLGYFQRTLEEEEMHRVERHLTDCEMCSDELEGLSKMKSPGDLDLIVEELSARIGRRRGRILGMTRNYALTAAAALLLLVVGSVVVVRMLTRTDVPEQMTVRMDSVIQPGPEAAEPPPPADSRSLALSSRPAKPGKEKNESAASGLKVPVVQDVQEQAAGADGYAGDTNEVLEMAAYEEEVTIGGIESDLKTDSAAVQTVVAEYRAPLAIQAEAKKVSTEKDAARAMAASNSASVMERAMEEFGAGNYDRAGALFRQVTERQPGDYKAAYYLGYCYFMEKQYDKALGTLAPILKDKENDFYKEASALSDTIKTIYNR